MPQASTGSTAHAPKKVHTGIIGRTARGQHPHSALWTSDGPHGHAERLGRATTPHRLTPATTRGTGVPSQPSARRWPPRVWHTPRYPGGGHPPRRRSSKNNNV